MKVRAYKPLVTVAARLPHPTAAELRRRARQDRRTVSATVRLAVELYLGMRDRQGLVARCSMPDGQEWQRLPLAGWEHNHTGRKP